MAKRNVSLYEAKKIKDEEERKTYRRWEIIETKENWPRLGGGQSMNRIEEGEQDERLGPGKKVGEENHIQRDKEEGAKERGGYRERDGTGIRKVREVNNIDLVNNYYRRGQRRQGSEKRENRERDNENGESRQGNEKRERNKAEGECRETLKKIKKHYGRSQGTEGVILERQIREMIEELTKLLRGQRAEKRKNTETSEDDREIMEYRRARRTNGD